jgi:DNA-binding NarL/FixJ family response regulator
MQDDPVAVLLIDGDPETVGLIEEAFCEIADVRFQRGWRAFHLTQALDTAEAREYLAARAFDAILFSVTPDIEPVVTFQEIRSAAPETPVVIVVPPSDEQTAVTLMRYGAQDYLISTELDCAPLAHTLRCAVERHRLSRAQESALIMDSLTGLYNAHGFEHFADCYSRLADRLGLRLLVVEAGIPTQSADADLALLNASEAFRRVFEPTDIVARTGASRLSAIALVNRPEEATAAIERLESLLPPGAMLSTSTVLAGAA